MTWSFFAERVIRGDTPSVSKATPYWPSTGLSALKRSRRYEECKFHSIFGLAVIYIEVKTARVRHVGKLSLAMQLRSVTPLKSQGGLRPATASQQPISTSTPPQGYSMSLLMSSYVVLLAPDVLSPSLFSKGVSSVTDGCSLRGGRFLETSGASNRSPISGARCTVGQCCGELHSSRKWRTGTTGAKI